MSRTAERQECPEDWPERYFVAADEFPGVHRMWWRRFDGGYECTACDLVHGEPPEERGDTIADVLDRTIVVAESGHYKYRRNHSDPPEYLADWYRHLQTDSRMSGFETVSVSHSGLAIVRKVAEPIPRSVDHHRSGTCFDVESTDMRRACRESVRVVLDADAVVDEVRHQENGYHTDLAYLCVDPDGLRARVGLTTNDDPLHTPHPRFATWWWLRVNGPVARSEAVGNGKYTSASKNRKFVDWLLDTGYAAQTTTGYVDAVTPPSIGEIHAVELKLRNWKKALEQAARAREAEGPDWRRPAFFDRYGYADFAWVALDAGGIGPALEHEDAFRDTGVGLLAVCEGGTVVKHVDAECRPRGRYTRDRAYIEDQLLQALDPDDIGVEPEPEPVVEGPADPQQASLVADGGDSS